MYSDAFGEMDEKISEASFKTTQQVMQTRKEKIKLKLKGKEVVEVIWSQQIRIAFLLHLALRLVIEVCFFYFGFSIQARRINVL